MTFDKETAGLSEELKARLAGCETPEELLALAKEEGYELSDEDLQSIVGGVSWGGCKDCPDWMCWSLV